MTSKKQKEKDRRRARRLAEQAWEAANEEQNLDLAEKLIRRAVATQDDNPVLWNDQGKLLLMRQKQVDAEQSFRTAISMAPNFAEPYAQLAAIRLRQGLVDEAVALQAQAVKHGAGARHYADQLESYRALARQRVATRMQTVEPSQAVVVADQTPTPPPTRLPREVVTWQNRLPALDWDELGFRLTRDACVLLPELIAPETCAAIAAMFDDDARFAKTVVMNQSDFGRGVYRYFRAPIPDYVDALRRMVYPHVARIANSWQKLLGETDQFPDEWDDFRTICLECGQTVPTPILLRYGPGGFNALHRDLRGAVYFPIQMATVLSRRAEPADPDSDGFRGGDFLLCDVPERAKSRRRSVPAGQGDTILFCTRDRLVTIGGAYGLQPVKHGVSEIASGERVVLGVPFHDYR
jgi:hypothetical protein